MNQLKRHNLPVNADRIAEDIDALAAITEPGRPYTRRAFTPMFLRGRAVFAVERLRPREWRRSNSTRGSRIRAQYATPAPVWRGGVRPV